MLQVATLSMLLWNGAGDAARGQSAENLRSGGRLDLVVSTSLFRAVNRNDAIPALRTWVNLVAQKRGIQFEPAIQIFNNATGIRKHVLTGASGVLVLDAQEYLQLSDLKTVEPKFSADRGSGNVSSRYLLIARDEPGGGSLQSLRNRRLCVHASTAANLGMVWLQSLLSGSRLEAAEAYFGSVEVTEKPSAALLPVFFGRADAAVIDEASFEVIKEMNPQLGKKLRVLSTSPELAEAVVCFFGNRIVLRDELITSVRDLHLDVQGKQILTTLRFSRMAPLNSTALERSIELLRKQNGAAMYPKAAAAPGKAAPESVAVSRGKAR